MSRSISVFLGWASIHVSIALWLIAALSDGRNIHRSHCFTLLGAHRLRYVLTGRAPLRQAGNAARRTIRVSTSLFLARRLAAIATPPAYVACYMPSGPRWLAIWRHSTEGLRPIERAIHTGDKPSSNPTTIAARSQTLSI